MDTIKCKACEGQFNLKTLSRLKGRCPSCGALVPVSDYCAYIPERRWWHLFSAAPIGMKCVALLCSIVCAFFLPCQMLLIVYKLFEGRYCHEGLHMMFGPGFHLALGCAGFFIAPVLVPIIWGAVRGRIPYVSFAMLAFFWGCWYLVESAGPDTALWIFYLSCLAVLLLIPYFTPAAIRWRIRCREEGRAFSVAVRSGADLATLEVREYPLKKVSIGVYLVLVLAILGLSGLAELKVFCVLNARGGAHPVADLGKDDGTLKEMYHSDLPGYISDDGTVLVYGPDWDREGGKCPPNFYPVWVARKKSGRFGGFEKMLCKMVDSGSSGNFTLETADRGFRFENDAFCYSDEESGGVIPIYCEIKEDGEMVRYHLSSYGWTP